MASDTIAPDTIAPEAIATSELLRGDGVAHVVNITSAGRIYHAFQQAADRWIRSGAHPPARSWLAHSPDVWDPGIPVVTVLDGHPHTLAWLPGAVGSPGISLGVTNFGQSGTRSDLYREFQIDGDFIATACLALFLR